MVTTIAASERNRRTPVRQPRPPRRLRAVAAVLVLAVMAALVPQLSQPADAAIHGSSDEVTYKEYWVGHDQFTGGCGDLAVPGGGARFVEPWPCEKTLQFEIPDDFSDSLRVEIYLDLWRNQVKQPGAIRKLLQTIDAASPAAPVLQLGVHVVDPPGPGAATPGVPPSPLSASAPGAAASAGALLIRPLPGDRGQG